MLNWQEIIKRIYDLYGNPTQRVLAEHLKLTRALLSKWQSDDPVQRRTPTWETMAKIVAEKNVTWDWLLEGREPKYRENT